jgi:hypothetical protein
MKAAIEKAVLVRTSELEKKYASAVNDAFDRDIAPMLRQAREDTRKAREAPLLQTAAAAPGASS